MYATVSPQLISTKDQGSNEGLNLNNNFLIYFMNKQENKTRKL